MLMDMHEQSRQLNELCSVLERQAIDINWNSQVFQPVSLTKDRLYPSELGVLRISSWLYVLYFEAGKTSIDFLGKRLQAHDTEKYDFVQEHLNLIHNIRTYLQHNLNESRPHDKKILNRCKEWLTSETGNIVPVSEGEWQSCLNSLIESSAKFLKVLEYSFESIKNDDAIQQILDEWEMFQKRRIPPHEFDRLILVAANDMGRKGVDAAKLRKRYYDKWSKELDNLAANYDFEYEARKLIEHALLNDLPSSVPINGTDILKTFETVEPGPRVETLLQQAYDLYRSSPCDRETLLERLKTKFNQEGYS